MFPAVPSVILHEREPSALLHPHCQVAVLPDPKSPATPSLMDHHGNRGAAPQTSRGKGSGVCGAEVQTLEAAEQGLDVSSLWGEAWCPGTAGQKLVPFCRGIGLL